MQSKAVILHQIRLVLPDISMVNENTLPLNLLFWYLNLITITNRFYSDPKCSFPYADAYGCLFQVCIKIQVNRVKFLKDVPNRQWPDI